MKQAASAPKRTWRSRVRRAPRPFPQRRAQSFPGVPRPACEPHDATPIHFTALELDARLNEGIGDLGFVRTTPVQSATIPLVLAGVDLIACAQTGTGKTAAFLLPIAQRLMRSSGRRDSTRALVLAPTRELAVQIEEDFLGLTYHTGLSAAVVYGGVPMGPQERALAAPVDLVVATPGRLLDHMSTGGGRFNNLEVLVLDEADRMLDMGFWPSVRRIVESLPKERQTLFFSATMTDDVFTSALQIMREPKMIQIGSTGGLPTTISHRAQRVSAGDKATWLARFLRRAGGPTLVFVRTKRGAERLARQLAAAGVRCAALHGDRTQVQRTAAVEGFRAGRCSTLVATDVAARGLDIERIQHVVNFEVPHSADLYLHRVGRTGRAKTVGTALTLVGRDELDYVRAIERSLKIRLVESPTAG